MHIIRNLSELGERQQPAVVTVGNFDGVHLAHQRLFQSVVESARRLNAVATAVTFDPHPTRILAPERTPKLLTTLEQKTRLIERQGIERLVVLPFTRELSELTPQEFVRQVLVEGLGVVSVHVGENFRFGHRHAGDVQLLAELACAMHFQLEVLSVLEARGERVSSSRIRQLLSEGRVGRAGRLLGRSYSVGGAIVHGSGVGKTQTVPTLNLAPVDEQLPKDGVYVTRTRLGEAWHESVSNVGHKPTFGEHRLTVESFLLDFGGELHATEMDVEFLYRLRDEVKFPDAGALKAQIQKDVRRAANFFRLLKLLKRRSAQSVAPR